MTEKEIAEIRRRFKADKSGIAKIRGCYVNENNEIVTEFSQPLAALLEDEANEILSVMKKSLSGGIGKNLIDIAFANRQVLEGEEHKMLMNIRNSSLNDETAVKELFGKIIGSVKFDSSYIILLANDKYDVFSYSADGEKEEDSSQMFSYIICCVCPIKLTKQAISFYPYENSFHNIAANAVVSSPEIGFMFPAFDDRAANIYNALFYTKNTAVTNSNFTDSIFKCDIPLPAARQKEEFNAIIADTVAEDKKLGVIKAVQDEVCAIIEEYKADKSNEPPEISKEHIKSVLKDCELDETELSAFEEGYNKAFGEKTKLSPQNLVDTKQFTLQTPDVTIKVNPERSDLVKTQIIDGAKYILIRADENVEVNGININIE